MITYLINRELYETLVCKEIPKARQCLWIATADLKDLYAHKHKHMVPFLEILSDLVNKNVEIRLLHAKKPGPAYWQDYDRYPNLDDGMEMMHCPRVHLKSVIIDHRVAYSGSANFTGAGIGAKGPHRRNFEAGFITDEAPWVEAIAEQFDEIWRGDHCVKCQRKGYCQAHEDTLET